jgi:hypothetical protein
LNASSARLPSLRKWCGGSADGEAKVGWFRATDGVLLDGATLGTGKTGVVLAHESPADLCGMVAGSRLGSLIAGVVSVSGEKQLANRCGPATELDALAAVPKLRALFLILGSREDGYLLPQDARELEAACQFRAQAARALPRRIPRLGHPPRSP